MNKKFWIYTAAIILTSALIAACGGASAAAPAADTDNEASEAMEVDLRAEDETIELEEVGPMIEEPTVEAETPVEPSETVIAEPTPRASQEPLAHRSRCETEQCQALVATYGLEGIYGYTKDSYVQKLQIALEAYADMLGSGNREMGQAMFRERVSGENGLQRIEFVEEMRSGRRGAPYARFAPDAMPELGELEPDVYAIWCSAGQMLGLCEGFGILPGTILVDVSTRQHLDELSRTIAHELTHALDSKSGETARALYDVSGAYARSPEVGGSLQEQFAELIALWLFPRSGDPVQDWDPAVNEFITNYMGPNYVSLEDSILVGTN